MNQKKKKEHLPQSDGAFNHFSQSYSKDDVCTAVMELRMKAVERIRYWLGPDIQQKSSENANILTIDHVYALKI